MADLAALLACFDLERLEPDPAGVGHACFRGPDAGLDLPRAFGGQLIAQTVIAAGRTVSSARRVHSLHAYFIRSGDARRDLHLCVESIRDGRTVSSREVRVEQDGRLLCVVLLSFTSDQPGQSHQPAPAKSGDPFAVPELKDAAAAWGGLSHSWREFDSVEVRVQPTFVTADNVPQPSAADTVWKRARGRLPADPLVHCAVFAFASDMTLLSAGSVPHGTRLGERDLADPSFVAASLDHAIWFHRPVRMDRWLRAEQRSSIGAAGRALMHAEAFDDNGTMVATVVQEGLLGPVSDGDGMESAP